MTPPTTRRRRRTTRRRGGSPGALARVEEARKRRSDSAKKSAATRARNKAAAAGLPVDASGDDPINPQHYKSLGMYSALHVIDKWGLNYLLGNALKYIQRAGKKGSTTELEDLKKAQWYLARHIHMLDPENEPDPAA
jgi:hypothetical protein